MTEKRTYLKIEASEDGVSVLVDGTFIEILSLYILAGANLIPQNDDEADVMREKFVEIVSHRIVWENAFASAKRAAPTFIDLSQIKDMKRRMENDEEEQMD